MIKIFKFKLYIHVGKTLTKKIAPFSLDPGDLSAAKPREKDHKKGADSN